MRKTAYECICETKCASENALMRDRGPEVRTHCAYKQAQVVKSVRARYGEDFEVPAYQH